MNILLNVGCYVHKKNQNTNTNTNKRIATHSCETSVREVFVFLTTWNINSASNCDLVRRPFRRAINVSCTYASKQISNATTDTSDTLASAIEWMSVMLETVPSESWSRIWMWFWIIGGIRICILWFVLARRKLSLFWAHLWYSWNIFEFYRLHASGSGHFYFLFENRPKKTKIIIIS